jgi:hypothetical protein
VYPYRNGACMQSFATVPNSLHRCQLPPLPPLPSSPSPKSLCAAIGRDQRLARSKHARSNAHPLLRPHSNEHSLLRPHSNAHPLLRPHCFSDHGRIPCVREWFKDDAACRSTPHRQSNAMVGTRNNLRVSMRPITVPRVSECWVSSDH